MVALLDRLGAFWHWSAPKPTNRRNLSPSRTQSKDDSGHDYPNDLTKDQIAYLHELAEERQQAWKKHERELAHKQK